MRDPGEVVTKTLVREFCEEALSRDLKFDRSNRVVATDTIEKDIKAFFQSGIKVKKSLFKSVSYFSNL